MHRLTRMFGGDGGGTAGPAGSRTPNLLPGGGSSPRIGYSAGSVPLRGYSPSPKLGQTPQLSVGSSLHGAARSSACTPRCDRFTLLGVCFIVLLLYTILRQAAVGPLADADTAAATAHSRRHSHRPRAGEAVKATAFDAHAPSTSYQATYTPSSGGSDDNARTPFTLERVVLLEANPDFPDDSTAETIMLKPRRDTDLSQSYHICTFTNVCATPSGLSFRFQQHAAWTRFRDLAKRCEVQAFYWENKICHCFHYAFKPDVLPYEFFNEIDEAISPLRAREAAARSEAAAASLAKGEDETEIPAGIDSLARRYPDPFAFVNAAQHGHYWGVQKWVSHHHIAHWAQKLFIFQSVYQHHALFDDLLPPLDGLLFHDTSNSNPPLEEHLLSIFNISVEAALAYPRADDEDDQPVQWAHPNMWNGEDATEQMNRLLGDEAGRLLWVEDLASQKFTTTLEPGACKKGVCGVVNPAYRAAQIAQEAEQRKAGNAEAAPLSMPLNPDGTPLAPIIPDPSLHTCFGRVSMSPTYGLLSMDAGDANRFRAVTAARMALPEQLQHPCPPRRAILLTRADRRILNVDELDALLLREFNLVLEHHEITGRNTSSEQVRLFATAGLVLSSHSSQLINVLFSHPSQALVEIEAEFYNVDFAAYAHALGLSFHYALGGSIPRSHADDPRQSEDYVYVHDPLMLACVEALQRACPTGDSWCFGRHSPALCSSIVQWPNKQMNFVCDLARVQIAVHSAIAHLQDRCFGKW